MHGAAGVESPDEIGCACVVLKAPGRDGRAVIAKGSALLQRRFLTSDVAIVAGGQLFQQVLTLGTGIAIARMLGSSGYGLVNAAAATDPAVPVT